MLICVHKTETKLHRHQECKVKSTLIYRLSSHSDQKELADIKNLELWVSWLLGIRRYALEPHNLGNCDRLLHKVRTLESIHLQEKKFLHKISLMSKRFLFLYPRKPILKIYCPRLAFTDMLTFNILKSEYWSQIPQEKH